MTRQPKSKRDAVVDNARKQPSKKVKITFEDDDYEEDKDLNLEQLVQKVKEAKSKKKQGDSDDYLQKFKEHIKKRQAEATAILMAEHKRIMDEEDKADAELDAIIRSLKEAPGKEHHPLYQAQISLCVLAGKILDAPKPVQVAIKSALDNDLQLGEDWEEATRDALHVLNLLKQEYQKKVERELSEDTKGDKENPGLGRAAKQSEKAVRKVVKTIHIPEAQDDDML